MINKPLRTHQILALLLVCFAVLMAALISRQVFNRLPHLEDEMAYLFQARVFSRGDIVIESPQPRRAFWQPFVIDFAQPGMESLRFSKYTPGWSALLSIGVLLGQPWLINAFFAGLTVALVYRLGSEIFSPDTGLIAAALVAFSPMALLLNATLMGHSSALFFTMLFIYAYWRIERPNTRRRVWWGAVAGVALGMMAINRPLSAISVATPFIIWSIIKLTRAFITTYFDKITLVEERVRPRLWERGLRGEVSFLSTLRPLLILASLALIITTAIPIYNYVATGSPTTNLYTFVWDYDRIGFGQGYGRNGHTLEKGIRHARFDLSLMAADLFGWQMGEFTPILQEHIRTDNNYFPATGLSFLLFPFGLVIGFHNRKSFPLAWLLMSAIWMIFTINLNPTTLQQPGFSWLWLLITIAWTLLPLLFISDQREQWTWLLFAVPVTLILVQMSYWIGSQLYSTRYFFEGIAALALLSALPIAWLMREIEDPGGRIDIQRQIRRFIFAPLIVFGVLIFLRNTIAPDVPAASVVNLLLEFATFGVMVVSLIAVAVLVMGFVRTPFILYAILLGVLLYSLYAYATPRIGALTNFNNITGAVLQGVDCRQQADQTVLVIVNGTDVRWRALAELMAVSSPYFDSPVVGAWNFATDDSVRQSLIAQFPERQIIEMGAQENNVWFYEACP